MKTIPGFEFLHTHHCVTGSMLHIFRFNQSPVSEEMLLGLGSGVGFIFWQQKGSVPFLGGRANVGRKNQSCLEVDAAERCGVKAIRHATASRTKAEMAMLRLLEQNQPVMLQVDMGLLPYFPFFNQIHFGYHVVAAAGFDAGTGEVTLADRDARPYSVQLGQLMAARGSTFKPFPPQNAWMEYDFKDSHQPRPAVIKSAILQCAQEMLHPPIKNMGVRGIQTAKQRMLAWPDEMDDRSLAEACANVALYIRADAGTGGGLFRWMYARFLEECAEILSDTSLLKAAAGMKRAGDLWEQFADQISEISNGNSLKNKSLKIAGNLDEIFTAEQAAWSVLEKG